MKIKIALIDTGIFEKELDDKYNKKDFYYSEKDRLLLKGCKEFRNDHGNVCLDEILKQNIPLDIVSINVMNDKGLLDINGIILGIEKAIEERVDIINISLGVNLYDKRFYQVCQKACANNILIVSAAAHYDEISYPANFKNVLCITANEKQKKIVKKVDGVTLSVRTESGSEASTSIAAAYFSGIFAKELANNPIYDKFTMLYKLYGIELDHIYFLNKNFDKKSILKEYNNKLYQKLNNKKIAAVLLPQQDINDIDETLLSKNVVAIYDHAKQTFYSTLNKESVEKNFDIVFIINTNQFEVKLSEKLKKKFQNYETYCVGNFSNEIFTEFPLRSHYDIESDDLCELKKPIILICGLSCDFNKFAVQVNLIKTRLYHFAVFKKAHTRLCEANRMHFFARI
jgi:subtilisin family serine protease